MTKEEFYKYLKTKSIWYEITKHEAVYSMQDLVDVNLPYPEGNAKNIFLVDDKNENYYLLIIKGNRKVNLKKFKKENKTRTLSLAASQDLMKIMKLTPGSVTPLGLLNDKEGIVKAYIDRDLVTPYNIIGIHPNDNTETLWLKTSDLLDFLKEQGIIINIIEL